LCPKENLIFSNKEITSESEKFTKGKWSRRESVPIPEGSALLDCFYCNLELYLISGGVFLFPFSELPVESTICLEGAWSSQDICRYSNLRDMGYNG
jgi:hypothetical protein